MHKKNNHLALNGFRSPGSCAKCGDEIKRGEYYFYQKGTGLKMHAYECLNANDLERLLKYLKPGVSFKLNPYRFSTLTRLSPGSLANIANGASGKTTTFLIKLLLACLEEMSESKRKKIAKKFLEPKKKKGVLT